MEQPPKMKIKGSCRKRIIRNATVQSRVQLTITQSGFEGERSYFWTHRRGDSQEGKEETKKKMRQLIWDHQYRLCPTDVMHRNAFESSSCSLVLPPSHPPPPPPVCPLSEVPFKTLSVGPCAWNVLHFK